LAAIAGRCASSPTPFDATNSKMASSRAIEMDDFANETANRKDEKSEQNQHLGLRGQALMIR
jgi:hypothetical protein